MPRWERPEQKKDIEEAAMEVLDQFPKLFPWAWRPYQYAECQQENEEGSSRTGEANPRRGFRFHYEWALRRIGLLVLG